MGSVPQGGAVTLRTNIAQVPEIIFAVHLILAKMLSTRASRQPTGNRDRSRTSSRDSPQKWILWVSFAGLCGVVGPKSFEKTKEPPFPAPETMLSRYVWFPDLSFSDPQMAAPETCPFCLTYLTCPHWQLADFCCWSDRLDRPGHTASWSKSIRIASNMKGRLLETIEFDSGGLE